MRDTRSRQGRADLPLPGADPSFRADRRRLRPSIQRDHQQFGGVLPVKPTRSTRTSPAIQSPHTRGLAAQEPARIDGPSFGEGTRDRIARAWTRFWFTPVDAIGLHVIRLLAGLLFIAWLLPFAGYLEQFFGINGWLDPKAFTEAARLTNGAFFPSWSILYL